MLKENMNLRSVGTRFPVGTKTSMEFTSEFSFTNKLEHSLLIIGKQNVFLFWVIQKSSILFSSTEQYNTIKQTAYLALLV